MRAPFSGTPRARSLALLASLALAALPVLAGGACAHAAAGPRSWVDPTAVDPAAARAAADATALGAAVVSIVAARVPVATAVIALLPPPDAQRAQPAAAAVAAGVSAALRRAGFALAPDGPASDGAAAPATRPVQRVRYLVTPFLTSRDVSRDAAPDAGPTTAVLLRVQVDAGQAAARVFRRDSTGALVAAGLVTEREGS